MRAEDRLAWARLGALAGCCAIVAVGTSLALIRATGSGPVQDVIPGGFPALVREHWPILSPFLKAGAFGLWIRALGVTSGGLAAVILSFPLVADFQGGGLDLLLAPLAFAVAGGVRGAVALLASGLVFLFLSASLPPLSFSGGGTWDLLRVGAFLAGLGLFGAFRIAKPPSVVGGATCLGLATALAQPFRWGALIYLLPLLASGFRAEPVRDFRQRSA